MLQDGSLVVADEALRQAIKYALDQLGYAPNNAPLKKRRTSFDEQSLATGDEYNGPFKIVTLRNSETGEVSGFAVVDGKSYKPSAGTCDPMLITYDKGYNVPIFKYQSVPTTQVYVYAYVCIDDSSNANNTAGFLVSETALASGGNLLLQYVGKVFYQYSKLYITQGFEGTSITFTYDANVRSEFYTMICYNKPSGTELYTRTFQSVHVNAGNVSPIGLSVSAYSSTSNANVYLKVIAVYDGETFSRYEVSFVNNNPESDTVFGYLLYNTSGWCYQGGSIAITNRWV